MKLRILNGDLNLTIRNDSSCWENSNWVTNKTLHPR